MDQTSRFYVTLVATKGVWSFFIIIHDLGIGNMNAIEIKKHKTPEERVLLGQVLFIKIFSQIQCIIITKTISFLKQVQGQLPADI